MTKRKYNSIPNECLSLYSECDNFLFSEIMVLNIKQSNKKNPQKTIGLFPTIFKSGPQFLILFLSN